MPAAPPPPPPPPPAPAPSASAALESTFELPFAGAPPTARAWLRALEHAVRNVSADCRGLVPVAFALRATDARRGVWRTAQYTGGVGPGEEDAVPGSAALEQALGALGADAERCPPAAAAVFFETQSAAVLCVARTRAGGGVRLARARAQGAAAGQLGPFEPAPDRHHAGAVAALRRLPLR